MSVIQLPKGTLLLIEAKDLLATPAGTSNIWNRVSEHNRSPISVGSSRIEKVQRMSNGSLRKLHIADKKVFNVSWSLMPSYRSGTVDGYWGAEDLKAFYYGEQGKGTFRIRLNFAKSGTDQTSVLESPGSSEEYTVSFTDCSFSLIKRGFQAHWDVNISMEEV